jgi:hypothetical protein
VVEIIPKDRTMVLFACNVNGTHKFPPLVTGTSEGPGCFKNIRKLPNKQAADRKAGVTETSLQTI